EPERQLRLVERGEGDGVLRRAGRRARPASGRRPVPRALSRRPPGNARESDRVTTRTVETGDGRTLLVHEAGDPAGPIVVYQHGTPSDGRLYEPWIEDAKRRGIRLVGYDRPGYGGSTRHPGRRVVGAAQDVRTIVDALGGGRFATWGISGGAPHALACATVLDGGNLVAAASLAAPAPFGAE